MASPCSQVFGKLAGETAIVPLPRSAGPDRNWYAVYTIPRNERTVARYLGLRQIESFLPTCETMRRWKNRHYARVVQALFPTYVFVKIYPAERGIVLGSPGVLSIVGNRRGPSPLPDREIEFLRSAFSQQKIEPYRGLVIGRKVRIRSGLMQGVEGTLVRKQGTMRFVLTLELINQHASIEVAADDLELVH